MCANLPPVLIPSLTVCEGSDSSDRPPISLSHSMHGADPFAIWEDHPRKLPTQTLMQRHVDWKWMSPEGSYERYEMLGIFKMMLHIQRIVCNKAPTDLVHLALTCRKWYGARIFGRFVQESQHLFAPPSPRIPMERVLVVRHPPTPESSDSGHHQDAIDLGPPSV